MEDILAWIDCEVEHVYEMGDHLFVFGRVVALDADPDHDGDGPHPAAVLQGHARRVHVGGLIDVVPPADFAAYTVGLDVLSVMVFVVIGRRSHDEGSAVAGVFETAAPFLVRSWRWPG